jgi:hypothetical protein
MQNVAAIQSNTTQLGEGNANIAYELGHLHLVPPDQFVGGDVQTYLCCNVLLLLASKYSPKLMES